MQIRPASIDQLQRAADGRMVLITAAESTVAADLQRLDKRLRLRWAENGNPPFFAVYQVPEGGCPCPDPLCEHGKLVLTAAECDDRIVKRCEYINPHGRGRYDFAADIENSRKARERDERHRFEERVGETAERAAHALRKELSLGSYRGGIIVPREVGK